MLFQPFYESDRMRSKTRWLARLLLVLVSLTLACIFSPVVCAQQPVSAWQDDVRLYAQSENWIAALRIVDREITREPRDMDVKAWRARILAWSGRLAEAEHEYLEILKVDANDPDNWMALAAVYAREERPSEALKTLDQAVELYPRRADLRAARGRALRAQGNRRAARVQFQKALELDPANGEARQGLLSLREDPRHELRFGEDNDLFSFGSANHNQGLTLVSRWNSRWATNVGGNIYQRGGHGAEKFSGSVTTILPRRNALTLGGAIGHDNRVIPQQEAFFAYDHGVRLSEARLLRAVDLSYGQHWYWYADAQILTLNGAMVVYFPRDWTWSLGLTGARSHFSGTSADWKPSGTTRLGFPLAGQHARKLSGNIFYGVGTENFGQVDQIGSFASQNYGGGLRFQFTDRQDITASGFYQKRTQNRTQTSIGFTYGFRF